MLMLSLRENPSAAVFSLRDPDTQPTCRLCDLTNAQHIRPVVAHVMAGECVNRGRRYLVLESVRADTRLACLSKVPVPADGAGGLTID
jgi:hypothetical protein